MYNESAAYRHTNGITLRERPIPRFNIAVNGVFRNGQSCDLTLRSMTYSVTGITYKTLKIISISVCKCVWMHVRMYLRV